MSRGATSNQHQPDSDAASRPLFYHSYFALPDRADFMVKPEQPAAWHALRSEAQCESTKTLFDDRLASAFGVRTFLLFLSFRHPDREALGTAPSPKTFSSHQSAQLRPSQKRYLPTGLAQAPQTKGVLRLLQTRAAVATLFATLFLRHLCRHFL